MEGHPDENADEVLPFKSTPTTYITLDMIHQHDFPADNGQLAAVDGLMRRRSHAQVQITSANTHLHEGDIRSIEVNLAACLSTLLPLPTDAYHQSPLVPGLREAPR